MSKLSRQFSNLPAPFAFDSHVRQSIAGHLSNLGENLAWRSNLSLPIPWVSNHPSPPSNGRQPLFSLASSFNSNPLKPTTLLLPNEIPNEGKAATPVTKEELGRATWTFLHTLAAQFTVHDGSVDVLSPCGFIQYPDNPTRQQRKDVKELMAILSRMYPCKECADHFKEILRANPVQAGSQAEFSQWLCHVHNVVNRSLGKMAFSCELVDARWSKLDCEQRACDLQGTTMNFGDKMQ